MPIEPNALSTLAAAYTRDMTSIRGRRVQRLVRREFSGADAVWVLSGDGEPPAVFGLSSSGAAVCTIDGRGPRATVLKWRLGAADAVDTGFDLAKDSLPVLDTRALPVASLPAAALRRAAARPAAVPAAARELLAQALRSLDAPSP